MIKGKNITLRALELEDISLLYDWENDMSVWQLSNTMVPFSRYILEQYLISSGEDIFTSKQLRLMIDFFGENQEKATIGTVDLFDFDPQHRRAGIGILIHKNYRQKGAASETIQLLKDYAKNTLFLHQLYCNIGSNNEVSLKLFQKQGFGISGTKLQWAYDGTSWQDEYFLQCFL